MSTEAVELFTTLLALAANVATVGLLVAHLVARTGARKAATGTWADRADRVLVVAAGDALVLAWLVAVTATAGSLYFSEIADFTPCTLCWYQRIAMYPLVVVLGVAVLRRDRNVRAYVWPITAVGAGIALYHYLLEWFPSLDAGACSVTLPCDIVWFRQFGFATLAYMALSGFLLIAVLLVPPPALEEA